MRPRTNRPGKGQVAELDHLSLAGFNEARTNRPGKAGRTNRPGKELIGAREAKYELQ
jgi:hypothetical protein